jgi:hypothetical protein
MRFKVSTKEVKMGFYSQYILPYLEELYAENSPKIIAYLYKGTATKANAAH